MAALPQQNLVSNYENGARCVIVVEKVVQGLAAFIVALQGISCWTDGTINALTRILQFFQNKKQNNYFVCSFSTIINGLNWNKNDLNKQGWKIYVVKICMILIVNITNNPMNDPKQIAIQVANILSTS